jgi:hypothetical protein
MCAQTSTEREVQNAIPLYISFFVESSFSPCTCLTGAHLPCYTPSRKRPLRTTSVRSGEIVMRNESKKTLSRETFVLYPRGRRRECAARLPHRQSRYFHTDGLDSPFKKNVLQAETTRDRRVWAGQGSGKRIAETADVNEGDAGAN